MKFSAKLLFNVEYFVTLNNDCGSENSSLFTVNIKLLNNHMFIDIQEKLNYILKEFLELQ